MDHSCVLSCDRKIFKISSSFYQKLYQRINLKGRDLPYLIKCNNLCFFCWFLKFILVKSGVRIFISYYRSLDIYLVSMYMFPYLVVNSFNICFLPCASYFSKGKKMATHIRMHQNIIFKIIILSL